MKVTRRRTLFYQRRTTNLYRLFFLAIFVLAGVWFTTRLGTGAIRNPFSPTPTSTRTIISFVLEGNASFDAGNLNAAITAYQQATQVDPSDALVWAELARIQAYSSSLLSNDSDRLLRLTEALKSADQAKILAPENSNVLAIHAFVLDWNADPALDPLRSGDRMFADFIFEAEQDAVHALSLENRNPLALAFYAEILVDQQKWAQAEQYILQAVELFPLVMDVHRVYGAYLESTANYRQAIEEYLQALTINPNLTFLYISIGQNYRTLAFKSTIPAQQTELYEQALENFAKAATINDQLQIQGPLPYLAIAKTYAQQGEFFAAALNVQKAIELDPTNPDLYGRLGVIYRDGRNFETAIIALKCVVHGCTPQESCDARNGCAAGDPGVTIQSLPLSASTVDYYVIYGNLLASFSPRTPSLCTDAVDVLGQVLEDFGNDPISVRNARDGLSICAFVVESQLQTSTPAVTPTPGYTPQP